MGCFNQSCNLTHVDINDDEVCMMLPIIRCCKENNDYESLNDGPFRYFKPFCLPIIGKYDHYGRIDEIQKDRNTEAIEKYFGMPIEDFVEVIAGRNEMYGRDSVIQRVYGKGDVKPTVEGLASIHFKTNEDKTISHPRVDWLNGILSKQYAEKGKPYIPIKMYWDEKNNLVVEQHGYEDKVYSHTIEIDYGGGHINHYASQKFLEEIHKAYESHSKMRSYFSDSFVFGIPSAKQELVEILGKLTRSFIRVESYKKLAQKFGEIAQKDAERSKQWNNGKDWQKQLFEEYVEAVNEWNNARAIEKRLEGKKPEELTEAEKKELSKSWMQRTEPYKLWTRTPIASFKTGYNGRDFLGIYGDYLLDEYFLGLFKEFQHIVKAMYAANVIIYENHSLEQHGNINEQLIYIKVCEAVAKDVKSQRDYEYGEETDDEGLTDEAQLLLYLS